jgi:hypothetical protein
MTVMTEDAQQAAEVARRHRGWVVWASRPTATRARTRVRPRSDGVFAMTVEAASWAELDAGLAEQDQADARAQT